MSTGRTIIVGGGIAGLSLAAALAARGEGEGVQLIEREDAPGRHSTGKNASILRSAIDAPITRKLALKSVRLMRERSFTEQTGLVLSTGENTPWLEDHLRAEEVRALTPEETQQLAPGFAPRGTRTWHFAGQGLVHVPRMMLALANQARDGGVCIRTQERVTEVLGDGVRFEDGDGESADRVVIANGAFAREFEADLGLQVTRRHLGITTSLSIDPNGPVLWDDVAGFYARPEAGGLLACASDQDVVDPEPLTVNEAVREEIHAALAGSLPHLAGTELTRFWAGLRPLTPDDVPLAGFDEEGRYWLTGLGGHGITIGLALAEFAADHLAGEPVDPEFENAMRPTRFQRPSARS